MNQDELKQWVGRAAADYVLENAGHGSVLGVGTGSTVNCFIDAIAPHRSHFSGAVSSSSGTTRKLEQLGFTVLDPNEVDALPIYVDGADQIDPQGCMIKGGGGALTREKIIASMSHCFLCIADDSKRVPVLGSFAVPVEVVPMARSIIERRLVQLGGRPSLRRNLDGSIYLTDNEMEILDVSGFVIDDPAGLEAEISAWSGVLTAGVFASQRAHIGMFAMTSRVETVKFR